MSMSCLLAWNSVILITTTSLLLARVGIFFWLRQNSPRCSRSGSWSSRSRAGKTGQCGVRHGGDNILLRQKSFFSTHQDEQHYVSQQQYEQQHHSTPPTWLMTKQRPAVAFIWQRRQGSEEKSALLKRFPCCDSEHVECNNRNKSHY